MPAISGGETHSAPALGQNAIQLRLRGGKPGVWVEAADRLNFVAVRAGISGADGRVEILEGLKEAEAVIVHSERDLAADSRIKVVPALAGS